MIAVAVSGAAGRMGETTCWAIEEAEDLALVGRADPVLDVGLGDVLSDATVLVDFSTPSSAAQNACAALAAGVNIVIGTTGFEVDTVKAAAEEAWKHGQGPRAFAAPNFAIGAVLMMKLAREIAPHLPECEIVELHHDRKLDAPSGTASRTASLVAEAGGNVHEPIHSVRLPGLVAHQEVIFGGAGQTLTIRHDSTDRVSFMPGVLLAVRRVTSLPDPWTIGLEALL